MIIREIFVEFIKLVGIFVVIFSLIALIGFFITLWLDSRDPETWLEIKKIYKKAFQDFLKKLFPRMKPKVKVLKTKSILLKRDFKAPILKNNLRKRVFKKSKVINIRRTVKPNFLPYHLEKGWQQRGMTYEGYYRCRSGAFKGEIKERPGRSYAFYIFNPPQSVLSGGHGACFTGVGNNRYHIHFGVNSKDLDSGIMAVERLLYRNLR